MTAKAFASRTRPPKRAVNGTKAGALRRKLSPGSVHATDIPWRRERRKFGNAPNAVVWELLVAPELKERWMNGINSVTADNQMGRVGNGSTYHCAHEAADFI